VFVVETENTCRGGSMLESIRCLALHSRPRRAPVPHEQRAIYKIASVDSLKRHFFVYVAGSILHKKMPLRAATENGVM